jgi:hypothetical protein
VPAASSCLLPLQGYHYLYFELSIRVSRVSVRGRVRADFIMPLGLGGVKLGFVRKPSLAMDLESTVTLGLVPVPLQDQIADLVRSLVDDWLVDNLVEPNTMHFRTVDRAALRRSRLAGEAGDDDADSRRAVDDDVERAVLAALTHRLTTLAE